VGGLGVVTRAVLTGTPLEVHDGFDPAQVAAAARRGANLVALVPTALHRVDPTAFRRILLGGSAVPSPRPPNAVATYGMTETGGGVFYDGRPLAGVECRVAEGEIQVRCPMLLRAYRDGTDPRLPDGWYPTGDAGTFDGREVLIHGRLDDVIVTGGEKVWPARVESVLGARSDVAGVTVVGRTHATWGEAVTAVVVPADPSAPPTLDALREEAKRTLPSWYAPTALELVGELPRTTLGKIRRAALRLR
jgi:O-succinylbenzoic acid--CoA ligase